MSKTPHYPFPRLEYGESKEVSPGIYWLRMPLPFALDHINLWALEDGDGWTIIDTGYNSGPTFKFWENYLSKLLGGKKIQRLIITHFHPDHVSLAGWFSEKFGAPIWMTYSEWMQVQLNRAGGPTADIPSRLKFYAANGMKEKSIEGYKSRRPDFSEIILPLPPTFFRIMDGDCISINGNNWEAITGAGHSPEHVAFWCSERRLLISGDQILPRISTNISLQFNEPDGDPLGLYLSSLSKFSHIDDGSLTLPSHDRPFYGVHDRIKSLVDHHEDRLGAAFEACRHPITGAEMVPVIFNRQLDEHQLGFALGEALAHANRLVFDGKLTKELCSDGCIRYSQIG